MGGGGGGLRGRRDGGRVRRLGLSLTNRSIQWVPEVNTFCRFLGAEGCP